MDKKAQTIETYNKSAKALADKFDALGTEARLSDIEEAFALVKKENPTVLEIGCGNGRDAAVICMKTTNYIGMDVSGKLIELAVEKVPQGNFVVADVEDFVFQTELDIVFAFASLIHVPKESLRNILEAVYKSLNPNGVFRLSMKYADTYTEVTKEDEFGIRTYYHYSDKDIAKLAEGYSIIKNEVGELRGQEWLEVLLQKL
jgi:trans-aconitate methyltransferase